MMAATSDDTRRILEMLSQSKITVEEAEKLLAAVERPATTEEAGDGGGRRARWLRVAVDKYREGGQGNKEVSLRIPVSLVRAGVKLSSLIPNGAFAVGGKAEKADPGANLNLATIDPKQLEELIDKMGEMTVDIDNEKGKSQIRIWCE
jgi:hypothetical protein